MNDSPTPRKPKWLRICWGLFAWIGIPALFAALAPLGIALDFDMNGLLFLAILLTAAGTVAIVKGQQPARLWIALLYPLPMVLVLMSGFLFAIVVIACC